MTRIQKKIGIFIFDGVEELDFVGPYEVFTMINEVALNSGERVEAQAPWVDVKLISCEGNDVTGSKGMRVGAHCARADIDSLDVLLIPGGRGSRTVLQSHEILDWVAHLAEQSEWVTSVCTGAFVLAKAGLTKERRLTTHWENFDEFHALGLQGTLVPEVRYVRDGNLVTSAGISAGIDMSLWLTGQMFSPDFARRVQRAMQYDPAPPYTAEA